jgi:hypothetical protein
LQPDVLHVPGASFEVMASRDRPRGRHTPHSVRLVVLDDVASLLAGNPLARLANGGIVALPTHHRTPEALWASLPPYVKAIAFDRHAHVLGWATTSERDESHEAESADGARWLTAAAFAGVALAALGKASTSTSGSGDPGRARPLVDGSLVAREVSDAIRFGLRSDGAAAEGDESIAERAGNLARRAFEVHLEVPRATIERDTDGVGMGRHDERATLR